MSYTEISLLAVLLVVVSDLVLLRTRLLTRAAFWAAYSIIVFFQLITNGWLTGREIVRYDDEVNLGLRIAYAPAEDLAFGFALVLLTLSLWVFWGSRGVDRT
jgi:lycopene cyclase domain-containing protein